MNDKKMPQDDINKDGKKIGDLVFNHDLKRWELPKDFNYEEVSLFLREKEDE